MVMDASLEVRPTSAGAMTADEADLPAGGLDIGPGGTPMEGMVLEVNVPVNLTTAQGADTNKIKVTVKACATSGGTYEAVAVSPDTTPPAAGKVMFVPFYTDRRYIKVDFDVTDDAADGVDFGDVSAYLCNATVKRKSAQ